MGADVYVADVHVGAGFSRPLVRTCARAAPRTGPLGAEARSAKAALGGRGGCVPGKRPSLIPFRCRVDYVLTRGPSVRRYQTSELIRSTRTHRRKSTRGHLRRCAASAPRESLRPLSSFAVSRHWPTRPPADRSAARVVRALALRTSLRGRQSRLRALRAVGSAGGAATHRAGCARDASRSRAISSAATACSRVTEGKWSRNRSSGSPAGR